MAFRNVEEKRMFQLGSIFQFGMFISFVECVRRIGTTSLVSIFFSTGKIEFHWERFLSPWMIPSHIGWIIFVYFIITLYFMGGTQKLKTGGLFRYTRHPMYTALLLMDTSLWVETTSYNALFLGLQAIFIACVVIAGYCQEKETLSRFGEAAEAYYAKTPRLFFMYPWTKTNTAHSTSS